MHIMQESDTNKLEKARQFFLSGLDNFTNKKFVEAKNNFIESLFLIPDKASTLANLSATLLELKEYEETNKIIEKALILYPNDEAILLNYARLNNDQEYYAKSLEIYNKILEIYPNSISALINKGNALRKLNELEDSLISYEMALSINPLNIDALINLADLYNDLKLFNKSLDCYNKVLSIDPFSYEGLNNKGVLLKNTFRYDEALEFFNKALQINPELIETNINLLNILRLLNKYEDALLVCEKVMALNPKHDYLLGTYIYLKMQVCDWNDYENSKNELVDLINFGVKASDSLVALIMIDSLPIHRRAAEIYTADKFPLNVSLGEIPRPSNKPLKNNKIKIGYFSADLREHPVSYLMVELFEKHNSEKFDIYAFYNGENDGSDIQNRIFRAFDGKLINISLLNDKDTAKLSREIGINIAVDLTGMTQGERVGVFSYRAAPIQIGYIGYLGTMGTKYYDYIIADEIIIPEINRAFYSEKIIYLPSYQVNDSKRLINEKNFSKSELNLPETGFIFTCFNNNYKFNPTIFDSWMRILLNVPDSVLFLFSSNKLVISNLKKEAEKRGVNAFRIIFGNKLERSLYLSRYKVANLFLDTFPYNAGTTASDALWAGLPVLTCAGSSFASRVASSILISLGLSELVTYSLEEYEKTAIELATDPIRLNYINNKIKVNRNSHLLFDSSIFTSHLETAYHKVFDNYISNSPLDHIFI